jgi:hypothetical protein
MSQQKKQRTIRETREAKNARRVKEKSFKGAADIFGEEKKPRIKPLLLAVLLIIAVLASVVGIRLLQGNPPLTTGESYYNIRLAQTIKSDPFIGQDPIQNTPYSPDPYHYLLALMLTVVSADSLPIFFPLVLGLLSAFIFFRILLILGVKKDDAAYSLIILAVSPAFIVLFTGLYAAGLIVLFSLLIIFFIIKAKKSKYELVMCLLLFFLLALSSLTAFLITFLIILVLCLALKRKLKLLLIPFIPSALAIGVMAPFLNYNLKMLSFHAFEFRNIVSVLRADIGFDIFLLMLFLIGFVHLWMIQENKRLLHLAVLALLGLSFFNTIARVFATFIITFYCVDAIVYFYKRKWELDIIRTGTLILVLCSLVFALVNQVSLLVQSPPDSSMQKVMLALKDLPEGLVLSDEKSGFLVELYSEKTVFLDSNSYLFLNYREKRGVADTLFNTARLKDAEPIIQAQGFKYFLITPDIKQNFWEDRERGFWFLIRNSEKFIRYSKTAGIELWEYIPE